MDEFRIDSHKLIYHIDRVNNWLKGIDVYPIYLEVSPTGACNHRCSFCGLDYMGYRNVFLATETLKKRLTEMGRLGVKSIMYAGEGEPLLHKDIGGIINHTKASGIDVALTTNGVLLTEKLALSTLPSITWIKISINAGTEKTYARVHGTREGDFTKVLENVRRAVRIREEGGLKTTIGMQLILLPENAGEAVTLARLAKEAGADYLVVKPYSQHLKSITHAYEGLSYKDFYNLRGELEKFSDERFHIVFRIKTMKKLEEKGRTYTRCLAIPFWSYIDSEGGVWGCSAYLGDKRFLLGNINEQGFEDIWRGEKRKELMEFVQTGLDTSLCRINCRMDEVNRYLWELRNPPLHVNFI